MYTFLELITQLENDLLFVEPIYFPFSKELVREHMETAKNLGVIPKTYPTVEALAARALIIYKNPGFVEATRDELTQIIKDLIEELKKIEM